MIRTRTVVIATEWRPTRPQWSGFALVPWAFSPAEETMDDIRWVRRDAGQSHTIQPNAENRARTRRFWQLWIQEAMRDHQ